MGVPRLLGADQAVQGPEVADDLPPSALIGEMAEIGRGGLGSMAAQIGGVDAIARGVERGGETGVAAAMLGEPVRNLDDRARRTFWQPTPREEALAVVGAKGELAPRHCRPLTSARRPRGSRQRLGISLVSAGGVKPVGDREILLAESVAIG